MLKDGIVFSLKGGEFYITERENDAFRVREGSLFVYVVPVRKSGTGRRAFLCEVMKNEVIPSLFYTDSAGGCWRFCFVAKEDAMIEVVEDGATGQLKERFVNKANIRNYREEGFAGSLVDFYRIHAVAGNGFVRKNKKARENTENEVQSLMEEALKSNQCSNVKEEKEKKTSFLYQVISGIAKIRAAGLEDRVVYEYMKSELKRQKSTEEAEKKNRRKEWLFVGIKGILVLSLGLFLAQYAGEMEPGRLMLSFAIVIVLLVVGSFFARVVFARRQWEKKELKIQDIFGSEFGKAEQGKSKEEFVGRIVMDQVSFAYPSGEEDVLKNISLSIAPGEYVGIIGPSGCGKSTLIKLLLGLEKPACGKICYDGDDLEQLNLPNLRRHIGVVLQEDRLISGSIYENITITMPEATPKQVDAVIRAVGLTDDLADFPMGLFTLLNEDGGTLSSGQRQRILIARALLKEPDIVFFDEATSALDQVAQKTVCDTLEKMKATRVVIAHRLSTVKKCDRIIVMDDGKIVEQGNYEALMERKGLFYQLAGRQISE